MAELTGRLRQVQEWLDWQEQATAVECGAALGLSRDSASAALNRLVKHGYARREAATGQVPTKFFPVKAREENPEFDSGWMAGYESGMQAGIEKGKALAVDSRKWWEDGFDAGLKQGKRDLGMDVLDLVTRMQIQIKASGPVYVHSKTCWAKHPGCALEGVRRLVARETAGLIVAVE